MPVPVDFRRVDEDLTLPVWRRGMTSRSGRPSCRRLGGCRSRPTMVVSTAIATRDFQDVHHDRDLAQSHGSKDIFLNILTTTGLVERYVTDWAGPDATCSGSRSGSARPAYPYDTLTFTGTVASVEDGVAVIDVRGAVSLGDHVTGTVRVRGMSGADRRQAAIAGIGATEFSKESGRSELQLSVEAVQARAGRLRADAGRRRRAHDVHDGHLLGDRGGPRARHAASCGSSAGSTTAAAPRARPCSRPRWRSRPGSPTWWSATAASTSARAAGSGSSRSRPRQQVNTNGLDNAWTYPMGLGTPAATVAMQARRYMHEYGATSEDFGRVAVADRRHAATNPNAFFYGRPITLEDHQASRMIVEPLHLLDCCQESDGAVAIVVVSAERARDLRQRPAYVAAAAQGSGADQFVMTSYYRDDIGIPEMGVVGRELWRQSGLGPGDMRDGRALRPLHAVRPDAARGARLLRPRRGARLHRRRRDRDRRRLPLNTHGGQLGEAYIHGMNGIAEGVRQIRGTSVNQVDDVEHVLVTAGTGVPTSGLVLSV